MNNKAKEITAFAVVMFVIAITMPQPAHAYLDPSTGSYALQSAFGAVFALMFYSRNIWTRVSGYCRPALKK